MLTDKHIYYMAHKNGITPLEMASRLTMPCTCHGEQLLICENYAKKVIEKIKSEENKDANL